MQFRHYTQQSGYTYGYRAIVESQILRDDIFAIEGLIVDLTSTPGIGFWNHTLPTLRRGGVWSQEILWLEPVTACVNTNLTIDYQLYSPDSGPISVQYNLTDRGGFANLPFDKPELNSTGQNVDVYAHADYGAFITNNLTMYSLGATRNTSYVGKTFPIEAFRFVPIFAGRLQFLHPGMIVNISTEELYEAAGLLTNRCQGYGAFSTAGINTVGVHCILILGPPTRLDGEDPRLPDKTTIWTQNLTLCASTVRMRMQNVTFSFNGTMELSSLHISRKNTGAPVLWGVQKTMLPIVDIDLLWGRVADAYEEDQSIWTHRYEYLYLPARYSNIWAYTGIGNPSSMALAIWQALRIQFLGGHDYSGAKKYSLLAKWQSLIGSDPINGPSNMLNRVWTDLAANNLMGSHTTRNISAASYGPSTSYDPNYGVAFILLVSIWLPTLLIASFLLLSGRLKLSHIRHLLNETSIGRAAVGDSVLVPSEDDREREPVATDDTEAHPSSSQEQGESSADKDIEARLKTSVWMKTRGETLVAFGPIRSAFGDGNGEGGDPPNTDTIELENPQSDFTVRKEKLRAYLRELVKLERNGGA
ncbi:hypothetical protein FRC17_010805 [Serendipita sp. 399]|nr:hypothetical protein FRC17_010805 [Serendipita sp. 399]